jgi:hypothetical protein
MRVLEFRRLRQIACTAALALLASCESSPWYEHRFVPAPLEGEVSAPAGTAGQARALVTVLGIAKPEGNQKDRAVVRMRIENIGSTSAKLEADSLSLVSADLKPFGPPSLNVPEMKEIPPGGNDTVDVAFPLPNGQGPYDLDLSGLNLRFTVAFGDQKVTTGMTFQRADWRYYDSGYPRMNVGVGVGWYHVH